MIKKLLAVMVGLLVLPMIANATLYDMTTKGDEETISGAIFTVPTLAYGGAGTGNIDSFVRIGQQNEAYERGYNTDAKKPEYDTKSGTHTHSVTLADMENNIVNRSGTDYYQFVLDFNEQKVDPRLTLVDLEIYLLSAGDLTGYPFAPAVPKFDLFSGQPASLPDWSDFDWNRDVDDIYDTGPGEIIDGIMLDYTNFAGSGAIIDLIVLIPTANFPKVGDGSSQYLYLYSAFGKPDEMVDDGFEEWATVEGELEPVPEPGTLILLGSGLAGLAGYGKLRFRRKRK